MNERVEAASDAACRRRSKQESRIDVPAVDRVARHRKRTEPDGTVSEKMRACQRGRRDEESDAPPFRKTWNVAAAPPTANQRRGHNTRRTVLEQDARRRLRVSVLVYWLLS